MAVTDTLKLGIEFNAFYCLDYDADETTVGAEWVELGYITDISFDEDPAPFEYYNKYELQPAKRGRPQYTGSINQMFTNSPSSVYALAKAGQPIALKLEVADNGEGSPTEVFYVKTVNLKRRSFNPGNLNEAGEASVSVDFSYADSHFYQPS